MATRQAKTRPSAAKQPRCSTAKQPAAALPAPRFKGRTFCFTGTLANGSRADAAKLVRAEKGKVVESVTAALDYLVVGQTRGGGTSAAEKKARKLNQGGGGAIRILDEDEFRALFTPSRDEALAMLTAGPEGIQHWNRLRNRTGYPSGVDLGGTDFRKADLSGVHLENVGLDGADFREANLTDARIGDVADASFDGACLRNAWVDKAVRCSMRGIDLEDGGLEASECVLDGSRLPRAFIELERTSARDCDLSDADGSATHCDLTGSRMPEFSAGFVEFIETVFRNVDLREAELQLSTFHRADFTGADARRAELSQSDFTQAKLAGAKLAEADLSNANLTQTDLTGADLRGANLFDADLTGATVDGADFEGANVVGLKLGQVDPSKAKGLAPPPAAAGKAGPKVRELEKVAKRAHQIETSAVIDLPDGPVTLTVTVYGKGAAVSAGIHSAGLGRRHEFLNSLTTDLPNLVAKWGHGILRVDLITAKSTKSPVAGKALKELCIAAWCEACGVDVPTADEIRQRAKARQSGRQELLQQWVRELRQGGDAVARWNALSDYERQEIGGFSEADLSGADLSAIDLSACDLRGANFEGTTLTKAQLRRADARKANFTGADLSGADLLDAKLAEATFAGASLAGCQAWFANLRQADLRNADLTGTELSQADLRGADLSTATLKDVDYGVGPKFDEHTRFRSRPPKALRWAGTGPDPRALKKAARKKSAGPIDIDTFLERLKQITDKSKLDKAMKMLKADRFRLFAQVEEDSVEGVVKSQTDPDLVYSCRLAADGSYACCTQNLNICGGLRGSPCKHLLVLVVGLTKGGELDPTAVDQWIDASHGRKPELDKDRMSETFLRYKGAEAGEIDWRPTETIPEDYYAF